MGVIEDLSRVDLNLLVALDVLLEEQHVTRAAERLSLGQSSMSGQLARLRKLFNDPLLVRQGSEMVRTPLAETLREPIRLLLGSVDSILAVARAFDPATSDRCFRVTSTDYVALIVLAPLMVSIAEEAPGVSIHFRTISENYSEELRRGETDIVIMPIDMFDGADDTHSAKLFDESYVALVATSNTEVGESLTVEQLLRMRRISTFSGHLETLTEKEMTRLGYTSESAMAASATVAPFMIQHTSFVVLTPERLARYATNAHEVRIVENPLPIGRFTESMFWAPRTDSDPGHSWLRARILEHVSQLGDI